MELLNPSVGLVFWMTLSFVVLIVVLKKFAWNTILNSLKQREEFIENALKSAKDAEERLEKARNAEAVMRAELARERDEILRQAREAKEQMISEAKARAAAEAEKMIQQAKDTIRNEKMEAMTDLRNQVAALAIEVAEKILCENLSNDEQQKKVLDKAVQEITLN